MFIFALAVLASFVAGMTRSITELESLSRGPRAHPDRGLCRAGRGGEPDHRQLRAAGHPAAPGRRCSAAWSRPSGSPSSTPASTSPTTSTSPGLSPAVDVNSLLDRNGFNRPSSTATQPIEFGVVMAMLLPFALQQAFDPARIGRVRRWAPVALLFFAIPMSLSRSGIVGLAIALLWIIPTWPTQRRKPAYVVLLIGIASLKVVAPGLIGTFAEYFGGLSRQFELGRQHLHPDRGLRRRVQVHRGAAAVRPGLRHLPPRALPLHRQHLSARPGRIRDCRRPGLADLSTSRACTARRPAAA